MTRPEFFLGLAAVGVVLVVGSVVGYVWAMAELRAARTTPGQLIVRYLP
jgi:hypothetical protein